MLLWEAPSLEVFMSRTVSECVRKKLIACKGEEGVRGRDTPLPPFGPEANKKQH